MHGTVYIRITPPAKRKIKKPNSNKISFNKNNCQIAENSQNIYVTSKPLKKTPNRQRKIRKTPLFSKPISVM